MGFADVLEQFKPKRKVRLGTRCTYTLTQLGKSKAEEFGLSGPSWQVLAYLDENGQCTMRDITEGVHFSEEKTKEVLKRLIDSGYVKRVTAEL